MSTATTPDPLQPATAAAHGALDDRERTIVHLMRHGEVFNPEGILYGRLPGFVLSELGHEMAEVVGQHLANRDITTIISSPLERAQQTAAPSAAVHSITPIIDERAIEAGNLFEGLQVAAGQSLMKQMRKDPRKLWWLRNPTIPSWGEPYTEIVERMSGVITDARTQARGHEALVVSHQLPVWMSRCALEGRKLVHDPRKRQCDLASITSLTYLGDELISVEYTTPAAELVARSSKSVGA